MQISQDFQRLPGSFREVDECPPYTPSTTETPEEPHSSLPRGWIRQWHSKRQQYFYVDTTTNPPQTTWQHPLNEVPHHQAYGNSFSQIKPQEELEFSTKEPCKAPSGAFTSDTSMPTAMDPGLGTRQEQSPSVPREHPTPQTLAAPRAQPMFKGRTLKHMPFFMRIFRREPKWIRQLDKISNRMHKEEEEFTRRANKWSGKCDRRLLETREALARRGYAFA